MDFLLAKIKRMRNPAHYKVISDRTIYNFDLSQYSLVEYSPDHNLDDDALFRVSDFSNKGFCLDFLRRNIVSASFDQIPSEKYKEISYLCSVQNDAFCFQKVTPSTYLNRRVLRLGENVTVESCENKIFLNYFPDAVYVPSRNILVFKNLGTISSIFKGIDTLYKEATQDEVESFLGEPFINLSSDYDASKVSKPNRKRIALAMDSFSHLDSDERVQILDYIHEYCASITYDENEKAFSISTDEELKLLLYGIEQRFYTTMLGREKRLANSIQTIE